MVLNGGDAVEVPRSTAVSTNAPLQDVSPGCGIVFGRCVSHPGDEHSPCQDNVKTDTANPVDTPSDLTLSAVQCSERVTSALRIQIKHNKFS